MKKTKKAKKASRPSKPKKVDTVPARLVSQLLQDRAYIAEQLRSYRDAFAFLPREHGSVPTPGEHAAWVAKKFCDLRLELRAHRDVLARVRAELIMAGVPDRLPVDAATRWLIGKVVEVTQKNDGKVIP